MKNLIMVALSIFATNAFADCITKAEKAAVAVEAISSSIEAGAFDSTVKLLRKTKSKLTYQVTAGSSYTDGAATIEFPSVTYEVTARGSSDKCIITAVTLD